MTKETELIRYSLEKSLEDLSQTEREEFVNAFKSAFESYAKLILEREKNRDIKSDEDEMIARMIQFMAALGLLSSWNHVEWDEISKPVLKVVQ
jgi:myo-inositol catabolism protein IolC